MWKLSLFRRDLGKKYRCGEVIIQQGDVTQGIFVIQKGAVEIYLNTEAGEEHLTFLKEGEMFGEVSMFANKAQFSNARALVDSRIIHVDEKTFISNLHQDPSLAFRMIRQMAQRIYELDRRIMERFHDARISEDRQRDQLTGLPSFVNAEAMLEEEVKRSRWLMQTMAFAVIDIDEFKVLGNQFGEAGLESILKALSEVLRYHLRKTDIIGRYGRDRFPVILYEADGPAAIRVMENVRKSFEKTEHEINGQTFHATFSCGIAVFPEHNTASALRRSANKALSTAKQEGRNMIILADPGIGY
ncbi:MAG: GGDEF domain-containing protein [Magnetococcales bacterium]|nr:GGDEF domain-containing protein [Magnetococcales bacterium]